MNIDQAIAHADAILPGTPVDDGEDPRWQAIIEVGAYVESNPEEVWQFVLRWGCHEQEDLRDAIACCLLEHLLEAHHEIIARRADEAAKADPLFADMARRCWFDRSEAP